MTPKLPAGVSEAASSPRTLELAQGMPKCSLRMLDRTAPTGRRLRLPRLRLPLIAVVVLAGLVGFGLWSPLVGAPASVWAQKQRATVRLDGRAVFRVGPSETTPAAVRAQQIEARLLALLANPSAITPATIEPESASPVGGTSAATPEARVINIAGVPVVRVTLADAQDHVTTVDALALQWAHAIDTALARAQARRLSPWQGFVVEVQGAVQTAFARLIESATRLIPRVLAALLVILLFWAIAATVRVLMRVLFRRIVEDLTTENLIKQVAYYAVLALGILLAADALGFEPQTVVAGLGLTSLALGFALRDIISNFVSGLLILGLRPFRLGDEIVVGEIEGTVVRIELRATQIRTYDGRLVLVPNAELFTSRVTNNTASPVRRGSVTLFVGYDSDLAQAAAVIRAATQRSPGVLEQPPASVRIRELGQEDVVFEARFWTDSRRSDFVATGSAVRGAIVEALREAGIGLPDPDVRFLAVRDAGAWRAVLRQNGREVQE